MVPDTFLQALTQRDRGAGFFVAGLLSVLVCAGGAPVLGAPEGKEVDRQPTGVVEPTQVCMLNNFVIQLQEGIPYVYQRKIYYLCCVGCVRQFSTNPEEFSKAVDPVNGQTVDKALASLYALKGTVYYFSSSQTLDAFAKDPGRYLNKAEAASLAEPLERSRTRRTAWR